MLGLFHQQLYSSITGVWCLYCTTHTLFKDMFPVQWLSSGLSWRKSYSNKNALLQGWSHRYIKIYGRHHNLVDRCEISISQIRMDLFAHIIFFPLSPTILLSTGLYGLQNEDDNWFCGTSTLVGCHMIRVVN